jgi:selenocysteine lyase/cysteine desulfurase
MYSHRSVLAHIRTIPELLLLGSTSQTAQRLPVFSFLVRHPRGTFLHHNFVCTILNDVFGVQARGGCACAGPYAQDLLGIDPELAKEYETVLLEDR